jgi:hypothetical protein
MRRPLLARGDRLAMWRAAINAAMVAALAPHSSPRTTRARSVRE